MTAKETILGVNVSNHTYETLVAQVYDRAEQNKQSFIVAVNPEKIVKAEKDAGLRELINSADFQIPDGVGVLIASKIQGGSIKERITGVDLMIEIVKEAQARQKSIFLYGAKPGIAEKAKASLQEEYPYLQVAGVMDGYNHSDEAVIKAVNESHSDILFVAMGSPRQEEWINQNKNKICARVFQGVGGSFDVLAGVTKRAPAFFRNVGLEWLYRLLSEPKRWKRQMALPSFIYKALIMKNK
ncbi:WecB/TagA/CpsF family glycosyltransferase [Lentibacillus sp. JNUCC-1]|uniref:WecB/TagA/CpsF family glycosyltransferase n=1 Tax=Lentibacillus sp. JNUCC-1 TaxID=2654513 RepID=UPI0012E8A003|nr:WecB/TagA/CpsF family glycosyltransferase [Lentibacillus sp. JNUCC-1]